MSKSSTPIAECNIRHIIVSTLPVNLQKKNTNDQTAYKFLGLSQYRKNKNSFSVLTVEYFGAGRGFQWGKIEQNRKRHGSLSVNGQP